MIIFMTVLKDSLNTNSGCIFQLTAHPASSHLVHISPCAADSGGLHPRLYKFGLLWWHSPHNVYSANKGKRKEKKRIQAWTINRFINQKKIKKCLQQLENL